MTTNCNPRQLGVQTSEGPVVIPSDRLPLNVINYCTGTQTRIRKIKILPENNVYRVVFSDGREIFYHRQEFVFIGGHIMPMTIFLDKITGLDGTPSTVHDLLVKLAIGQTVYVPPTEELSLTSTPPVSYNLSCPNGYLKPDPYTAGAILVNCNKTKTYANMPADYTDMIESILISNNWSLADETTDDDIGFIPNGVENPTPVTWDELYSDPVLNSSATEQDSIPDIYSLCEIPQRWEFVRGLFDAGCNVTKKPLTVSVSSSYKNRLEAVQRILWSLGVMSSIADLSSDPEISRPYILRVNHRTDKLEMFFNDIDKVDAAITNDKLSPNKVSRVYVKSIERAGDSPAYALRLEVPGRVYMTDNFLPRVGI